MLNTLKLFIITVFVLSTISCTTTQKTESMGQYLDSTAVTTKVKARLADTLGTNALAIQVKTYKDEVQLSGFVNNAIIKRHAGTIASNTTGVMKVRNDLIVK